MYFLHTVHLSSVDNIQCYKIPVKCCRIKQISQEKNVKIGSIWRFNVSHNLYINFCAGKTSKARNFHLNSRAFHPPAAAFTTSDPFLASTDWTMHHLCFFSWFNVDPIHTFTSMHFNLSLRVFKKLKLSKNFDGIGYWERWGIEKLKWWRKVRKDLV